MFHNDWITYDYNNLTVNEYPNKNFHPTTFKTALKEQSLVIAQDVKPAVFVSGGIDSQAIAFGFKSLNIDADYIYIRSSYNGHYDKLEYFFVNEFLHFFSCFISDSFQHVTASSNDNAFLRITFYNN